MCLQGPQRTIGEESKSGPAACALLGSADEVLWSPQAKSRLVDSCKKE